MRPNPGTTVFPPQAEAWRRVKWHPMLDHSRRWLPQLDARRGTGRKANSLQTCPRLNDFRCILRRGVEHRRPARESAKSPVRRLKLASTESVDPVAICVRGSSRGTRRRSDGGAAFYLYGARRSSAPRRRAASFSSQDLRHAGSMSNDSGHIHLASTGC